MKIFKLVFFIFIIIACNSRADSEKKFHKTVKKQPCTVPGLLKGIKAQGGTSNTYKIITPQKKVIYIDPVEPGVYDGHIDTTDSINLCKKNDADYIFITNTHNDHFQFETINKICKKDTKLIVTSDCGNQVKQLFKKKNIKIVSPGKIYKFGNMKFATTYAYTVKGNGRTVAYSKYNDWVGYILYLNKHSYYFSGSTDALKVLEKVKADVVFLAFWPTTDSGDLIMTGEKAAKLANIIMPKIAVPCSCDKKGNIKHEKEMKDFFNALDKNIMGVHYGRNGEIINIVNNK